MPQRRVHLTGATGFVGGALARALAAQGNDVHALCRPGSTGAGISDVPVTWHEGDITQPITLQTFVDSASEIVHCAGRLGQAGVSEREYLCTNVDGLTNLLSSVLRSRTRARVLHVSTTGVLGPVQSSMPDETAPLAPDTPYERSKAAAEQVAKNFAAQGLEVVIARPGFLYGPGDRHVLGLFNAIESGRFFYIDHGRQYCHPTFIGDAVTGMLLCLQKGRSGEAYNITGPSPVTFRELVETTASVLGVHKPQFNVPHLAAWMLAVSMEGLFLAVNRTPPLSRAGVAFFSRSRTASWQKAKMELGYVPRYDLAAGLAETVDWYRKHGWLSALKN